ncbi:flagellin [Pseudoroseomonas cervicalis]|uniref:Flagellin n=1 Tax=Pseudoroseomonas cervicalis ATCC 49957 TaxID=525371 RepID=D5RP63_9PROT|nr:flagellin [Pseudoroseomonas cervicalis]EFH10901.1 bacterial flagellin domain protein [Pseudoroseomonas cervicalis ATCC 49957]
MANSVITNSSAKVALQSLNKINQQLDTTQKKVSTGYKVSDAKDDGAAYAVAQKVRADVSGLNSANDQLGGVNGLLTSTLKAVDAVSTTLTSEVSNVLTKLSDSNLDAETRKQYTEQFKSLTKQMNTTLQDASYNGTRLLGSTDTDPLTGQPFEGKPMEVTRNEKGQTYTVNASGTTADQLSFTASIGGGASAAVPAPAVAADGPNVASFATGSNVATSSEGAIPASGSLDSITSISAAEAKALLQGRAEVQTDPGPPPVTEMQDVDMVQIGGAGGAVLKTFVSLTAQVNSTQNELGNDSKFISSQMTYNSARIDAMEEGLGSLVDADLAKESARLTALQTQQQLATTALSTANSAPEVLLSLFR